jgi:hypothetical protein
MLRLVLPILAIAALLPTASRALDCPSPEKKGQTPGGYTICKPSATGQCAPGRKSTRHARELVPMCEDGAPAKPAGRSATPPAAKSACAAGEQATNYKGYEVCKQVGGACGPGRRARMHHRHPELIICEDDPNAQKAGHAQITCSEHERPVFPKVKSEKPYCEPVGGKCGFGRVAVNVDQLGHRQMCVPK